MTLFVAYYGNNARTEDTAERGGLNPVDAGGAYMGTIHFDANRIVRKVVGMDGQNCPAGAYVGPEFTRPGDRLPASIEQAVWFL